MQISPVEIGDHDLAAPMEIFPRSATFPGPSPLGTSSCLAEAQGFDFVGVGWVCVCKGMRRTRSTRTGLALQDRMIRDHKGSSSGHRAVDAGGGPPLAWNLLSPSGAVRHGDATLSPLGIAQGRLNGMPKIPDDHPLKSPGQGTISGIDGSQSRIHSRRGKKQV